MRSCRKRDHAANRNPFPQLEVSDGLFSARHHRLLSGDGGDFGYGGIENLDILRCLSESDIHGNFFQPRHLHGVLVAELLHHRRHHFVLDISASVAPFYPYLI